MRKFIGFIFIIVFLISACNFSAGSAPIESTPTTAATQVPPSATAIPATPTLISTPPAALGTIALDFVALLCDAKWMNGGQHLTACPAADADHSGGYAVALDPATENLPTDTSVLLTIPATNGYAALFLQYPAFTVHKGDRFRATLRCQTNAACDVEYAWNITMPTANIQVRLHRGITLLEPPPSMWIMI